MSNLDYDPHGKYRRDILALRAQVAAQAAIIAEARETFAGIANANWWRIEGEPAREDFVDWAQSRARHALASIDALSAQEKP